MLNVSQQVYNRRLERMAEFIRIGAPQILIYHEARLIEAACRPSFGYRLRYAWTGLYWRFLPDWALRRFYPDEF